MRKIVFAVAAAVALGTATMTGSAMAAPHGGGGGMGHAGGGGMGRAGGFGHPGGAPGGAGFAAARAAPRGFVGHPGPGPGRFAFHRGHGRFFGPSIGLYAYGGPIYPYYGGCWVHRRVWTPYGWRWRLVDVCY